jgi:Fe2+ transport system protein FeoA
MNAPPTNLASLPLGKAARIVEIGGERNFRRRLLELGLLPGTSVTVLRVAPLGDPLELSLRGTCLSIRKREATEISVAPDEA